METLKNKQKRPFFRGKTGFLVTQKQRKETKNNPPKKQQNKQTKEPNKRNKTQKNKEGLGPSEVALRATSPDP